MAFPSDFEQSNAVLDPPEGVDIDDVSVLNIHRSVILNQVISCWKLTQEELDTINKTGRVWLHIQGVTMPPAYVGGLSPFKEDKEHE